MRDRGAFEAVAGELGRGGDARVVGPDGRALYVPGALPGERIRVKPAGGPGPRGRLVEVVDASPARRDAPCPLAARCGGCGFMVFDEDEVEAQKRRLLARVAGVPEVAWHRSPSPLGYRRRARLHFDAGRGLLGYRPRRGAAVVDAETCLVLSEPLARALDPVREALEALEDTGEIAMSETLDGVSIVVSARGPQGPGAFAALDALAGRPEVASVALRVQGSPVPSVYGLPFERHRGPDGLPLKTPLGGFVQASEAMNRVLSERVAELAAPAGASVVELFCGSGNFTVLLARLARSLLGVEDVASAVELARENLRERGLDGRVLAGDADAVRLPRADVLVLDAPRRGAPGLGRALSACAPERVALVSCSLESLARELRTLRTHGYRIETIEGFDMFPQTPHIEALVSARAERPAR